MCRQHSIKQLAARTSGIDDITSFTIKHSSPNDLLQKLKSSPPFSHLLNHPAPTLISPLINNNNNHNENHDVNNAAINCPENTINKRNASAPSSHHHKTNNPSASLPQRARFLHPSIAPSHTPPPPAAATSITAPVHAPLIAHPNDHHVVVHPQPHQPQPKEESMWSSKIPRRHNDKHIYHTHSPDDGLDDTVNVDDNTLDGPQEDSRFTAFQTARSKLLKEMNKTSHNGGPSSRGHASSLRKNTANDTAHGNGGVSGPGGKFVPPFVKKALQHQQQHNSGNTTGPANGQQQQDHSGPLSLRTLELLKLGTSFHMYIWRSHIH